MGTALFCRVIGFKLISEHVLCISSPCYSLLWLLMFACVGWSKDLLSTAICVERKEVKQMILHIFLLLCIISQPLSWGACMNIPMWLYSLGCGVNSCVKYRFIYLEADAHCCLKLWLCFGTYSSEIGFFWGYRKGLNHSPEVTMAFPCLT